jgi:hypothetical protein
MCTAAGRKPREEGGGGATNHSIQAFYGVFNERKMKEIASLKGTIRFPGLLEAVMARKTGDNHDIRLLFSQPQGGWHS